MLKEKTRRHLTAAKHREDERLRKSDYMQWLAQRGNKQAAKYVRQTKKQRKALAASLRQKRAEHGAELARVWHRAGGQ